MWQREKKPRVRRQVLKMITSYEQIRDEFLSFGNKERGVPVGHTAGYFRAKMLPFDDRVYITGPNWRARGPVDKRVMHLATIYPSGDVEMTPNFCGSEYSSNTTPISFGYIGFVLPVQTIPKTRDRLDHGIFILPDYGWRNGWNQARDGMPYRLQSHFLFNLKTRKPVTKIDYTPPIHLKNSYSEPWMREPTRVRKLSSMTKDLFAWKDFLDKRKKAIAMIKVLDKLETFNGPILNYEPVRDSNGHHGTWMYRHNPKRLLSAQHLALEGVFNAGTLDVIKNVGVHDFIGSLKRPSKELLFELNIYAKGSEWE